MLTSPSIDGLDDDLASRYDEIPYDALPHAATHPNRLAAVASVAGHRAPDVERCRVLEVGCNDGSNLIAMAVSLPGAHFVGCDLSPRAIDAGRSAITALGLNNVTLIEGDLGAIPPVHDAFDFIIAHGVYSWVPPDVRTALFVLAAERLAPNGVLYVSFNVLPGCRVRQAAWDVLHHHVDHIESARARLDAARKLAQMIGNGGTATFESDQALRAEFRAIAEHSDSELCHDDLAVPNEPVLFASFVRHAARHDLRYLTEAEFRTTSLTGVSAEAKTYLSALDPPAREQYLDFVRLRRYRQSLVVRRDAPTDTTTASQRLSNLHVSSAPELARAAAAGGVHQIARRLDPAAGGGGAVRKLLDALVANQPATYPVATLETHVDLRSLARPVEDVIIEAYGQGLVDLYARPPWLTTVPPERPFASPLARLQARTSDTVTTLAHVSVRIADTNALRLLPLVDGTRDRAALAAAVRQIAVNIDWSRAQDFVEFALDKFARLGLLMTHTDARETNPT